MIRTAIIEDEHDSREYLKHVLATYFPKIALLGQADSVADGIQLLQSRPFDLIFLDVELRDGDGFELLQSIDRSKVLTIFLTGHEAYAIEAIRHAAFDYLVKPLLITDLKRALERVEAKLKDAIPAENEAAELDSKTDEEHLIIHDGKNHRVIHPHDLLHLKADDHYITAYLQNHTKFVFTGALRDLEQRLPAIFFRIHRTHLINLKAIKEMTTGRGGIVTLINGHQVPVAYRKKGALRKLLLQLP